MNDNQKTLRQRIKGDLYLVMQKDKFHKVFNQNLQSAKVNTLHCITKDDFKQQSHPKPKSASLLPNKVDQVGMRNDQSKTTKRKKSQASIVQGFLNHQKQPNSPKQTQKQRYTLNVSSSKKSQEQNPQKNLNKNCNQQKTEKIKLTVSDQSDKIKKYKNFDKFFRYILDFKLMQIQTYNPKKNDGSFRNIDEILLSPRVKRSTKSLKVHFEPDHAEKDLNQLKSGKVQSEKQQQDKKQSLQASQSSFVDVQISDVSLEDQLSQDKTSSNKNNSKDSKAKKEMKKDKKVYFDFDNLNPNETSLDEINPLEILDQNENLGQNLYKSQSRIVSLQELKKRIKDAQQETKNYVHHGYFCDNCKVDPIVGRRYRCIECQEYDLCQKCYLHQCKNFRTLMNKYQRESFPSFSNLSFAHINDNIPLMKKKMSDIKEQESPSQNFSSDEKIFVNSENQNHQNEHVHIMQEVKKSRPQFQQNLSKVLKESNRSTNQNLLKSTQRNSQKLNRNLQPLTPQFPKHRYIKKSHIPFSKISFSERNIPFRASDGQKQELEAKRSKVEEIRKSTSQLRNLFK